MENKLDEVVANLERKEQGETVDERMARLGHTFTIKPHELEALAIANSLVNDKVFTQLATATHLSQEQTIVLPPGRYDHCSRGKGWARKGKGDNVTWGDRVKGGYEVGPGFWIVGSSDGFNRKSQLEWEVKHVQVGEQTWTVAN